MSCELAQMTVHGYFDDELDAVRASEFERHLESCTECQASLERMQSLRTRLRDGQLNEQATPRLREQLAAKMGSRDLARMESLYCGGWLCLHWPLSSWRWQLPSCCCCPAAKVLALQLN